MGNGWSYHLVDNEGQALWKHGKERVMLIEEKDMKSAV
jgi:hypothetical protein